MQTYEQGQVCYLTGEHGEAVKHVYLGSQWIPMSPEIESVVKVFNDRYSARDAEWQAMVDRAVDEAVAQAKKVAQASEDIRARDAEIRRECAERAVAFCKDRITTLQDVTHGLRLATIGNEEGITDKIDEALKWADHPIAPGPAVVLAAEVRRLRAMLEPTPDARDLAEEINQDIDDWYSSDEYPDDKTVVDRATSRIAAHDARLLDEAAERIRAEKVDAEATGDAGDIAYNQAIDDAIRALYESAAIKGAAQMVVTPPKNIPEDEAFVRARYSKAELCRGDDDGFVIVAPRRILSDEWTTEAEAWADARQKIEQSESEAEHE